MRIWSIHPKYLDTKGLIALWRESLLAKKVLEGLTIGYKNHPQLDRFKKSKAPIEYINFYLESIWLEATKRNYKFDSSKFKSVNKIEQIPVTSGQIDFEIAHLLNKLKKRDISKHDELLLIKGIEVHPLFKKISGEIETWEKT
jgi:hypothetical protein